MSIKDAELAALIGSRICHDLVSPIGAISGGLELVEMTGQADGPEMELIRDSVESALTRIKYFRIAFGSADDHQYLSPKDVMGALNNKAAKIKFHYNVDEDVSRTELRLVFLAADCMEHAFAMGGDVTIEQISGQWKISGQGKRMRLERQRWTDLDALQASKTSASEVQFSLLATHLVNAKRELNVSIDEAANHIELIF